MIPRFAASLGPVRALGLFLALGLIPALGLFLSSSVPALAGESAPWPASLPDPGGITEVVAAGPSWENFTNRDGTGLYHELLHAVFGLYGITVDRVYTPSERAYSLVREGRADFMTCHDKPVHGLVMAHRPMYANLFFAFFRKAAHPGFSGPEDLEGGKVVVRIGYYDQSNFPVPVRLKEVKTGPSALGMVVLGRADFYVDDANFIQRSLEDTSLDFEPSDFAMEPIGNRSYHPLFSDSPRGRTIMELYDRGMERLARQGALEPIFSRWGHPMPEYDLQ